MKIEKKTPNKSRKRETKSVKTAPLSVPPYKREDIEGILTNVMLAAVTIASLLLALTFFIAVVKH